MHVINNIAGFFYGFMYVCSRNYEIEFMNNNLIELIGRNAIGELCYKALQGLDEACPWCPNAKVFDGKMVCQEVLSPRDNRWYYTVNTPYIFSDDEVLKMSMFIDVTEQKLSEVSSGEGDRCRRCMV